LELPQGIPSHDTFAWVLAGLKPDELRRCFLNWMCVVRKLMQDEVVAIDGKMLRRSFD
jgi:DDE_Tnp_1-associated